MKRIAQGLKDEGYEIGVFSNMDQINGDMYKERGDFSQFSPRYIFLSYEMGVTKPHRAFYQKILTSTGLQPHEILLIDDHEDNIMQAEMMNFHTLHFSIQNGHQDLINKLRENNILISETTLKE